MYKGSKQILAVDIGGSKVAAGIVDSEGNIAGHRKFIWTCYDPSYVINTLVDTVKSLMAECPGKPDAVGFTVPGLADPANGMWCGASYMGIREVPLRDIVCQATGLPVFLDNDTNACCLAEKVFGGCKEENDFLYMTVSNGVGGAFFLNGGLYYGAHGFAGEYGMCVVKENGVEIENKGLAGCLEMYASGRGITRNYIEAGGERELEGAPPNGKTIAARAEQGEPAALMAFDLEGYYLGKVIAAACNLLDPARVVIGGGLSLTFDLFWPSLDRTMKHEHYLLEAYSDLVSIEPTVLGYEGGLYGAATVGFLGLEPDPGRRLGYRGR